MIQGVDDKWGCDKWGGDKQGQSVDHMISFVTDSYPSLYLYNNSRKRVSRP